MTSSLIRNATVILPRGRQETNILVQDGRIAAIDASDQAKRGNSTWEQIASWTSDAPARIWGLVGRGRIEVGYAADLVIVDPNRTKTIQNELQFTKTRWSPWHGSTLTGWPVRTIVNGKTVFVDDGTQARGSIIDAKSAERLRCDHRRGGYWSTHDGIGV